VVFPEPTTPGIVSQIPAAIAAMTVACSGEGVGSMGMEEGGSERRVGKRLGRRFDGVGRRFDGLGRFDELGRRFDGLGRRFDGW